MTKKPVKIAKLTPKARQDVTSERLSEAATRLRSAATRVTRASGVYLAGILAKTNRDWVDHTTDPSLTDADRELLKVRIKRALPREASRPSLLFNWSYSRSQLLRIGLRALFPTAVLLVVATPGAIAIVNTGAIVTFTQSTTLEIRHPDGSLSHRPYRPGETAVAVWRFPWGKSVRIWLGGWGYMYGDIPPGMTE